MSLLFVQEASTGEPPVGISLRKISKPHPRDHKKRTILIPWKKRNSKEFSLASFFHNGGMSNCLRLH